MENWSYFNAWCLVKGIQPGFLASWDLTDLVQFWLYENVSDESADDLDRRLSEPPANISPEILAEDPLWSAEAEMAMFKNLMP